MKRTNSDEVHDCYFLSAKAFSGLFPPQPETWIAAVMPHHHDSDAIQLFEKKQMVGEPFQVRAPPAAGIEMKSLRLLFDP
ncbi:MAG: hypothetical protein KDN05_15785 [Verrucomicrobiae bacterium]|nr:hypothetical protein [Verrucomicrobiae bacterium]